MTSEAQRIAIAEACGWTIFESYSGEWRVTKAATTSQRLPLPDYLGDLNAMHSAEKAVIQPDIKLRNEYAAELRCVDMPLTEFFFLHATAAQRAEAFLRCLNLWKE